MFVLGSICALAVGGTAAYAANGGSLLIGRANNGSALTTLSNTAGTALRLNSKAGTPSLSVDTATKVPNLNADLVDGMHATSFLRQTIIVPAADGTDHADCPAGTYITSGGYRIQTDTTWKVGDLGTVINSYNVTSSAPSGNGWSVAETKTTTSYTTFFTSSVSIAVADVTPLAVFAVCAKY
jgi:hypothetical protein